MNSSEKEFNDEKNNSIKNNFGEEEKISNDSVDTNKKEGEETNQNLDEKKECENNSNKTKLSETNSNENNSQKVNSKIGQKECSLEEKVSELTSTLQRLQAEFENYQKRTTKQNEEYKLFSTSKLIEELLPVLDSLEQGVNHNKELILVYEQLYKILNKNGLEKIFVQKNDEFDHSKMDCLMQENQEEISDNKVVNVFMTGYKLNNKILRTTKVSVNIKSGEESSENKTK